MRKWLMSGLAGIFWALFVFAPLAAGATATATGGSPGQGLEISPPIVELTANPGQTLTTLISIRDVTSGELIATGETDDFGAGSDENGDPKILLDETGATRYSLKYWVSPIPSLDLAPQELKKTTVTISVPTDAEPGGHYGVVRFTALPPNVQGTGVSLSASVGALILLTVNGKITHGLNMVQFAAGENNAKTSVFTIDSFFEHGPLDFLVRINNSGDVHEQPIGTITVKNTFGKTLSILNVNSTSGNILPGSIRRFLPTLSNKQLFGHYTAKLAMTYDGSKTLSDTVGFWVIPWKLVLLVLLGLIAIFFILKLAVRKYNDHIIKMAGRR